MIFIYTKAKRNWTLSGCNFDLRMKGFKKWPDVAETIDFSAFRLAQINFKSLFLKEA